MKARAAVLKLNGPIVNETSDRLLKQISKVSLLSDAYIFEIDSPGGLVVPSKEIADKIKSIKVPKIAQIRGCGASGAYWVASACDKIIANDMSIVGSIGVRSGYLEFSDLLKKYGVKYNNLNAGKFKGAGDPFSELTEDQRKYLEDHINETHEYFIKSVAKNRNMDIENLRKIADGRIFSGLKGKELGLVDELGGLETALKICEERLGKKVKLKIYEPPRSFFNLLEGKKASIIDYIFRQ